MSDPPKKHPCPDCQQCQWCSDDRCRLCLKGCVKQKLSIAEQLALYEKLNNHRQRCPGTRAAEARFSDDNERADVLKCRADEEHSSLYIVPKENP